MACVLRNCRIDVSSKQRFKNFMRVNTQATRPQRAAVSAL
jgi:hypothetical protein